jgi:putative addiction module CopG family antidote
MVIMSADVTNKIKQMTEKLVEEGMYKSQSEVVRDAIRQLAYKYNVGKAPNIEKVRKIMSRAAKKSGKTLSGTVREIRDKA